MPSNIFLISTISLSLTSLAFSDNCINNGQVNNGLACGAAGMICCSDNCNMGTMCCNGNAIAGPLCCPSGQCGGSLCCNGNCCNAGVTLCCGSGCCPVGTTGCKNGNCDNTVVGQTCGSSNCTGKLCCGGKTCCHGTMCCGTSCCNGTMCCKNKCCSGTSCYGNGGSCAGEIASNFISSVSTSTPLTSTYTTSTSSSTKLAATSTTSISTTLSSTTTSSTTRATTTTTSHLSTSSTSHITSSSTTPSTSHTTSSSTTPFLTTPSTSHTSSSTTPSTSHSSSSSTATLLTTQSISHSTSSSTTSHFATPSGSTAITTTTSSSTCNMPVEGKAYHLINNNFNCFMEIGWGIRTPGGEVITYANHNDATNLNQQWYIGKVPDTMNYILLNARSNLAVDSSGIGIDVIQNTVTCGVNQEVFLETDAQCNIYIHINPATGNNVLTQTDQSTDCVNGDRNVTSQTIDYSFQQQWTFVEASGNTWTPVFAQCPTCDPLLNPANGQVNVGLNLRPGATATFECIGPYNLIGLSSLVCQDNFTWSGTIPTCENNCQAVDWKNVANWEKWSECYIQDCLEGSGNRNRTMNEINGCLPPTEEEPCSVDNCIPPDPLSPTSRVIATIAHSLGCTILLSLLGVVFCLFVAFRIMSLERMLHMIQEISLFVGHVGVVILMKHNLPHTKCAIVGMFLQFSFLTNFTFFALETLQTFAILQNVQNEDGFLSWRLNLVVGFGFPFCVTAFTAMTMFHSYKSLYSCWINFGNKIAYATIIPLLVLCLFSIVMTEAATMGDLKKLPLMSRDKYMAALVSQKGSVFVMIFNLLSYIFGTWSLYVQNVALYSMVLAFNISLGVIIFIFHTMSNDQVQQFLKSKLFKKKI